MAKSTRGPERREDALSKARIVVEAIALLDEEGEEGLTFRALAARLSTGPGAIYWHIASKTELLVAASNSIVEGALGQVHASAKPREAIRKIALGVFEAVDAHTWVGGQLSRAPWPTATLLIFENVGRGIAALGVPARAQFTAVSALLSYVIGVSVQNASQGRALDPKVDRATLLETTADHWSKLDADEYPFTRSVAGHLGTHDDRDEFLASVDLILDGVVASIPNGGGATKGGARKPRPRAK